MLIGASVSEPHIDEFYANFQYNYVYICRTSCRKSLPAYHICIWLVVLYHSVSACMQVLFWLYHFYFAVFSITIIFFLPARILRVLASCVISKLSSLPARASN